MLARGLDQGPVRPEIVLARQQCCARWSPAAAPAPLHARTSSAALCAGQRPVAVLRKARPIPRRLIHPEPDEPAEQQVELEHAPCSWRSGGLEQYSLTAAGISGAVERPAHPRIVARRSHPTAPPAPCPPPCGSPATDGPPVTRCARSTYRNSSPDRSSVRASITAADRHGQQQITPPPHRPSLFQQPASALTQSQHSQRRGIVALLDAGLSIVMWC